MTRVFGFVLCYAVACSASTAEDINELRKLFEYDSKAPLKAEEKLLYERDGAKVLDLTYSDRKGGKVTALLVTPTIAGPHAGLVFGHWGQGNKSEFLAEAKI